MSNLVPVQAPALPELAVYLGRNTVPNKHTFKVIWGMKKITVARRCDGEGKRTALQAGQRQLCWRLGWDLSEKRQAGERGSRSTPEWHTALRAALREGLGLPAC